MKKQWLIVLALALAASFLAGCSLEDPNLAYTITYHDANGASGGTADSVHKYGANHNLSENGFTRIGYVFTGWSNVEGGEVQYTDKQSVKNIAKPGAVAVLYAQWTVNGGISWPTETGGTLTIINNTAKNMVIFQGQTPSASNILGGVLAAVSKDFDISDDVPDFDTGGYMILRGMSFDEYNRNKTNLSLAKIEYSAMATYGRGKKYRAVINSAYTGDYCFKFTNGGKIGIELRKNSHTGEKIGYLPSLAYNYPFYAATSDDIIVYPVYVYYSRINKTVTTITIRTNYGWADSVISIGPRPVTGNGITTSRFPVSDMSWQEIVGNISYPVAFVAVTNNVMSLNGMSLNVKFGIASRVIIAQNGYDSVSSGETNTFEVGATDDGQSLALNLQLYNEAVSIPIKDSSGNIPVIRNGYDYRVVLNLTGTDLSQVSSYSAVITEIAKRNVEDEIVYL